MGQVEFNTTFSFGAASVVMGAILGTMILTYLVYFGYSRQKYWTLGLLATFRFRDQRIKLANRLAASALNARKLAIALGHISLAWVGVTVFGALFYLLLTAFDLAPLNRQLFLAIGLPAWIAGAILRGFYYANRRLEEILYATSTTVAEQRMAAEDERVEEPEVVDINSPPASH